ncbi:hypothetical protein B0H21DRAFT_54327 [Amylocystis lapponica]|nr:hypothetical protein B0H21DRAFT_54327 [Amylocystis lapponica]
MSTLSPVSPLELRHITSNTNLASPAQERRLSNRNSQHLRTHRLGSRSPASIPSSPTSVHSSSSAIFERDIEPITPSPTSFSTSTDPHRIPRGRISEQLDQSVPSVLDSAAAALAGTNGQDDDFDSISIVAPAAPENDYRSGFTSPISRLSSRSPSPTGAGNRRSLLFSASPLQGSPPVRPSVQTQNTVMQLPLATATATPTSAYFSVPSTEPASEASSPTTATHHEHPLHTLPSNPATITLPSPLSAVSGHAHAGHPPSPKNAAKRLSFLSYMDLLSSIPASTLPLSSLTSSAQVSEPPPHLPSVIGFPQAQYAASSSAGSIHGFSSVVDRDAMVDDVGGEWEREGLGRGLEERLEALNALPSKA